MERKITLKLKSKLAGEPWEVEFWDGDRLHGVFMCGEINEFTDEYARRWITSRLVPAGAVILS